MGVEWPWSKMSGDGFTLSSPGHLEQIGFGMRPQRDSAAGSGDFDKMQPFLDLPGPIGPASRVARPN